MIPSMTRRRAIAITAAAAGLSLFPMGRTQARAHLVEWRGKALGAVASLRIHHHDRAAAERLIGRAAAEVQRLERIFSLYRNDSALVALNREGLLTAPPPELIALLSDCRAYNELTGGAFDPTIQPLWTLYRDHFTAPDPDPSGPSDKALAETLARVGFGQVMFNLDRVVLGRRGMALTLNGIAQGFITDRVVAMLRSGGVESSLVDMGEPRAVGSRPDGTPWRVGIADPENSRATGSILDVIDRAVATSGAYGFRFDRAGKFHHLIDPRTGRSSNLYRSMTVVMPTASAADALSTAFSLMDLRSARSARDTLATGDIYAVTQDGRMIEL